MGRRAGRPWFENSAAFPSGALFLSLPPFILHFTATRPSLRPHDLPALNRGGLRKPAFKDAVDRQHFAEESREVGGGVGAD